MRVTRSPAAPRRTLPPPVRLPKKCALCTLDTFWKFPQALNLLEVGQGSLCSQQLTHRKVGRLAIGEALKGGRSPCWAPD